MIVGQLYNFYTKTLYGIWDELTDDFENSVSVTELLDETVSGILDIFQGLGDSLITKYVGEDFDYGFEKFEGEDITIEEEDWKNFIYNVYLLFKSISYYNDLFFKKCVIWRLEHFLLQILALCYFNEETAKDINYDYHFAKVFYSIVNKKIIENKKDFYDKLDNYEKAKIIF